MKTNRLLSRKEATSLDLPSRIRLEAQLTDAEMEKKAKPLSIPPGWQFDDYRNTSPKMAHLFDLLGPPAGQVILDIGCGYHPSPIYFALASAKKVYVCDVSPKALAYVQEIADSFDVTDRVSAFICAAERLPLANERIDVIHGAGVLHHLKLRLAGAEIARVLRRSGKGGFRDPLGQNPLLELWRDHLPYRGKASAKGTDRPLTFKSIDRFGQHFSICSYRGFELLSMIVTFIGGQSKSKPRKLANIVDAHILRLFPRLQRYCRFVITYVEK